MKSLTILAALTLFAAAAACDVQSGMTKKSLEQYTTTPTPVRTPTPEERIDPADIITADTAANGPTIHVNKPEEGKKVKCDKYNRVMVNGDQKEVKIDGVCKQIMVNGDGSTINVTAVSEIVFNGSGNTVEHVKFANGKKPIVTDSVSGNTVTKVAPPDAK